MVSLFIMDHYFTIEKPSQAEFKDRGSKFIAYAFPVSDAAGFKKRLQELKKEHPKAVHHCFAYRIGTDGNTFRVSDDGEPGGTAGKPILGQLDSRAIINTAVIVVRYFGGTLLGVPGLINAYKTATSLALQLTPIVQKQVETIYSLEFDYTLMNLVMTIIKQFNCSILEQQSQLFCNMKIGIAKNREAEILYSLKEIKGIEFRET
ncbi:MAG: YigZ family protein [Chitinophagaceae bacterium]|nr:YigZ family protein [Chitinophagaceae bacterium]